MKNRFNILIVDDSLPFQSAFKELLELSVPQRIEKVFLAENGKEGVDIIEKSPVDIVFMDIDMPVMNGIEATHLAKTNKPDVYIVAVSLYNDNQILEQINQAGANTFVSKENLTSESIKRIFLDLSAL